MSEKSPHRELAAYLKEGVQAALRNPLALGPFITIIFIHFLVLEVLYFSNRFPLSKFFGPIIERLWGEIYLHYPFNFIIIPKLFQYFKVPLYIFLVNFLIATAIKIVVEVNNNKKITLKNAARSLVPQYIDIVIFSLISAGILYFLYQLNTFFTLRLWGVEIRQETPSMLRTIVLQGQPYWNLLLSVLVTAAFAYVLPIIVVDQKKIMPALRMNFKRFSQSWPFVLAVVLIPTLFYLPILLFKNSISQIADKIFPEIWFWVLAFSVVVTTAIDVVIYTVVTLDYLLEKEHS